MLTLTESTEVQSTPRKEAIRFAVPLRLLPSSASSEPAPVTCGIPVTDGALAGATSFAVHDPISGWTVPCQVDWSPDRTWIQATFFTPPHANESNGLVLLPSSSSSELETAIALSQTGNRVSVDTGSIRLTTGGAQLIEQITTSGDNFLGMGGLQLNVTTAQGKRRPVRWSSVSIEEAGRLRGTIQLTGRLKGLRICCRLSCYAGMSYLRCELTLHNPRRARHPGGYWDLGDPGSLLLREVALEADLALTGSPDAYWREQPDGVTQQTSGGHLELYQESSGGENWRSANHVNRAGQVPLRFCGYRVKTLEGERQGKRASPIVSVVDGQRGVSCAVEEFWQKFPTAIQVDRSKLSIKLWPGDFPDLHELQAGECCSRVVWLEFTARQHKPCERLAWVYHPPLAVPEAEHVAASGCVPYFPSPKAELRAEYQQLLAEAMDGSRNLFAKRETIDEYSWRNFGDMWADHEEAYADDERPVISHYNNQYDLLHGLLIQYLRTGDRRWWELADPLARHVMDIDIYRTSRDKPAYNNGAFWHTAHYHAVGRATHRSMSNTMRGKRIAAPGTGPGNEHNYTSGLLLYYYLTGCSRARETVVQLAEWVLAMDDGERHVLGLISSQPTGLATCTTDPAYHGPGRGAANSIHTLLNAWKLTGTAKYVDQAGAFIRRTIHPQDDIAARQLDNAELRWSYTVYLQALDRFLLETSHLDDLQPLREYARQSLLHYAQWLCEHEKFYLDEPEKLEYPTETWAAQELRKGTTLLMAARLSPAKQADRFRRRASEILDRAWQTLLQFESRVCTRPLALVLQQGHVEASLRSAESATTDFDEEIDFGAPTQFVSQKEQIRAMRRSSSLVKQGIYRALHPGRWLNVLSQSWLAERLRRCFD